MTVTLILALMTFASCSSTPLQPARSPTNEQKVLLELDRNIQRAMVTSDSKMLEKLSLRISFLRTDGFPGARRFAPI